MIALVLCLVAVVIVYLIFAPSWSPKRNDVGSGGDHSNGSSGDGGAPD